MNNDGSNKIPGFLGQILVGVVVGLVVATVVRKEREQ